MLLIVAFLYLGFRWNHVRDRQAALSYLRARNVAIEFASDQKDSPWSTVAKQLGLMSEDQVRAFDLSAIYATDDDLAHAAEFEELTQLNLRNANLSAIGFSHLTNLRRLESLDLGGAHFQSESLSPLKLASLRLLDLSDTDLEDEAIASICQMRGLQSLTLRNSAASDIALSQLGQLRALNHLDLSGSNAGEETARALSDHPRLTRLVLDRCPISDDDLESLAQCSFLQSISLEGTRVGDVGVSRLAACDSLQSLNLRATRASDRCLQALRPLPRLMEISAEETSISAAALEQFSLRNAKTKKSLPGGRSLGIPEKQP